MYSIEFAGSTEYSIPDDIRFYIILLSLVTWNM